MNILTKYGGDLAFYFAPDAEKRIQSPRPRERAQRSGIGELSETMSKGFDDPPVAMNAPVADEVKYTTCYMCACRCGIKVSLRDGAIRYIEGNRRHPVNRGVLCAKGSAGIMQHYSP